LACFGNYSWELRRTGARWSGESVRGGVCDIERGRRLKARATGATITLPAHRIFGRRGALGRKTVKSKRRKREAASAAGDGLSRREFARRAAAAAAMAAVPESVLGMVRHGRTAVGREEPADPLQEAAAGGPKLSAEALGEVDGKVAEIIRRYGTKLNDAQKADVRRLVREAQAPLEALRAFPLANSDEPATVFRVAGTTLRSAGTGLRATGTTGASSSTGTQGTPGASASPGATGGKKPGKGDA
jgi:hypothetical protein